MLTRDIDTKEKEEQENQMGTLRWTVFLLPE